MSADVFRDAKLLGFINKVTADLYRDPALNVLGVGKLSDRLREDGSFGLPDGGPEAENRL